MEVEGKISDTKGHWGTLGDSGGHWGTKIQQQQSTITDIFLVLPGWLADWSYYIQDLPPQ